MGTPTKSFDESKFADRLTVEDVAKIRRVPVHKVMQWCESGYIPYHVGEDGQYYFILSEVK